LTLAFEELVHLTFFTFHNINVKAYDNKMFITILTFVKDDLQKQLFRKTKSF